MAKADYDYTIHTENKTLAIVDLDKGGMSVTNDIECVVHEIAGIEQINPADYLIVYRDSQGCWDGWNHSDRSFVALFEKTSEEALLSLELHYNFA